MEWINLKDDEPKDGQPCWFYANQIKKVMFGRYTIQGEWRAFCVDVGSFNVEVVSSSHWMPVFLPEPPKED